MGVMRNEYKHRHGWLKRLLRNYLPANAQDKTRLVREFLAEAQDQAAKIEVIGMSGEKYTGRVEQVDECGAVVRSDPDSHQSRTALVLDNVESVTRV